MPPVFFAPDAQASGPAVKGSTPAGRRAARLSAESGGGVLGANLRDRKTASASLIASPYCSMRAQSPCSSFNGEAVVWTSDNALAFCGRHIEQYHAAQIARRQG